MHYFDDINSSVLASVDRLGATPVPLATNFASARRSEKTGELVMTTSFYVRQTSGQIRYVLIRSPKINIVNLFFFPHAEVNLPVYAMEIVVLGKKPIVAVIDAPCLIDALDEKEIVNIFSDARKKHSPGENDQDMPSWYADSRSGWDVFVRPDTLEELDKVVSMQVDLWTAFCKLAENPKRLLQSAITDHGKSVTAYKKHHAKHSPGRAFLERSFGIDWTEEYLSEVLFGE